MNVAFHKGLVLFVKITRWALASHKRMTVYNVTKMFCSSDNPAMNFDGGDVVKRYFIYSSGGYFSMVQYQLCYFGRGPFAEHFSEIISNLDQWFRKICPLQIFFIYSSGSNLYREAEP